MTRVRDTGYQTWEMRKKQAGAFASIVVFFERPADMRAFESILGQRIPPTSDPDRFTDIWYPPKRDAAWRDGE